MKRFFKFLFVIVIIVIMLICLGKGLGMLDFFQNNKLSEQDIHKYSNYYFNVLSEKEKVFYVKIANAIEKREDEIFLTSGKIKDVNSIINNVFKAYSYDNPETFYLSNSYSIVNREVLGYGINTIKIEYDSKNEINQNVNKLNNAVDQFLDGLINDSMTDFEKEVAIHDKLVNIVDYYEYEDIDEIPSIKHTAYGALVEHEAVCDGYAKAFKMLLDKAGIENIIVGGMLENTDHAWNMVRIDYEYYHVDVTSDDIKDENSSKYLIHAYFNLSDKDIKNTHEISEEFEFPKATETRYNYYEYNGYTLKKGENIKNKLRSIISENKNNTVLEFKADKNYSSNSIIDVLYELDYNNWKTRSVRNVKYNVINDVYIFK